MNDKTLTLDGFTHFCQDGQRRYFGRVFNDYEVSTFNNGGKMVFVKWNKLTGHWKYSFRNATRPRGDLFYAVRNLLNGLQVKGELPDKNAFGSYTFYIKPKNKYENY